MDSRNSGVDGHGAVGAVPPSDARGTDAEHTARAGVQAAKVALGERGCPWWEQTPDERRSRWESEVPLPH
jgi:hypothetical protein